MLPVIDQLEERVSSVTALVNNLREQVLGLERELAARPLSQPPTPPSPQKLTAAPPAIPAPADQSLREEIALLRAERQLVREKIRGLIREIDQVAW